MVASQLSLTTLTGIIMITDWRTFVFFARIVIAYNSHIADEIKRYDYGILQINARVL